MPKASSRSRKGRAVGYAVVGLGDIAQEAVLPAFRHARKNSRLVALVSSDAEKLEALGERYHVEKRFSYDDYDACLQDEEVDAVYVAVPNHLHAQFAVGAASAGVHVLCEKPMAVTEADCQRMIDACRRSDVRLMIAYRLHFDPGNLHAVELVESGKLGEVKLFQSLFSYRVKEGNIRATDLPGAGPLYDIGTYCINAARYLLRDEPRETVAFAAAGDGPRFEGIEEAISVLLRFPRERLAVFTVSHGVAPTARYRLMGTRGELQLDQAYEYQGDMEERLIVDGKTRTRSYREHDQFGPELVAFSDCVLKGLEPEPSGLEGLADVRIIEAIRRSVEERRPVTLEPISKPQRPGPEQAMKLPPSPEPEKVHAESPHQ